MPSAPFNGKSDHTTRGMYTGAVISRTVTSGATAWTNSAPSPLQHRETTMPGRGTPPSVASATVRRPARG